MKKIGKAVVLLSGGLDSATCLFWARERFRSVEAVTFFYGQRHEREIRSARRIARAAGTTLREVRLSLPWIAKSALVDRKASLPDIPLAAIGSGEIPSTYVPGRNLMFAAVAVSLADAVGAEAVVIGANAVDYSGYPDCRPDFYSALNRAVRLGTRRGVQNKPIRITTPLAGKDKAGIVKLASSLGVPLRWTWSCYSGGTRPCGRCDSCKLRAKGFADARREDPAL